jgi:HSP20 family protein
VGSKMAVHIRDPFAITRSLWQVPSIFESDWVDQGEQGMSVYETDDSVIVEAVVAGVPEDKIDVSIEGGTVTIKAAHQESQEDKEKKKMIYRQAKAFQYLYTTSLPTAVDANTAQAVIENGILKLILPKKEEAKPKKIQVSVKK